MKWRLVIRPRAETDLREARKWYESQRAGLGAEFVAEIDATIQALIAIRNATRSTIVGFTGSWRAVFPTSCSTEWKMTRSLYFASYMCAVITLGFFDQAIKNDSAHVKSRKRGEIA